MPTPSTLRVLWEKTAVSVRREHLQNYCSGLVDIVDFFVLRGFSRARAR